MSQTHWTSRVIAKLVADYLTQLVADSPETEKAQMFLDVCKLLKLTDEAIRELRVAVEIAASSREKLANLPECWVDVKEALEE